MTLRQIYKRELGAYCDGVSKGLAGSRFRAKIEILSDTAGPQVEAGWLPFWGVSYDQKSDTIEISLDRLHHRVRDPLGLYSHEQPSGAAGIEVAGIEIVARDHIRHVVRFEPPVRAASQMPIG